MTDKEREVPLGFMVEGNTAEPATKMDLAAMHFSFSREMEGLRLKVSEDFGALKAEMYKAINDQTHKFYAAIFVGIGVVLAGLGWVGTILYNAIKALVQA